MESFPASFQATKVHQEIAHNRMAKIQADLKVLRHKIVKAFQGRTKFHCEVTHQWLGDLTDDEQRDYYRLIKEELESRGFFVTGKRSAVEMSLCILPKTPRPDELEKILKQMTDAAPTPAPTPAPVSALALAPTLAPALSSALAPAPSPVAASSTSSPLSEPVSSPSFSASVHEGGAPPSSPAPVVQFDSLISPRKNNKVTAFTDKKNNSNAATVTAPKPFTPSSSTPSAAPENKSETEPIVLPEASSSTNNTSTITSTITSTNTSASTTSGNTRNEDDTSSDILPLATIHQRLSKRPPALKPAK